jgi:hypothetical protein
MRLNVVCSETILEVQKTLKGHLLTGLLIARGLIEREIDVLIGTARETPKVAFSFMMISKNKKIQIVLPLMRV